MERRTRRTRRRRRQRETRRRGRSRRREESRGGFCQALPVTTSPPAGRQQDTMEPSTTATMRNTMQMQAQANANVTNLHASVSSTRESSQTAVTRPKTRGFHSSTFQLNLSVFCGTGGVFRSCLGGCWGDRGFYGACRVYFASETAQVVS